MIEQKSKTVLCKTYCETYLFHFLWHVIITLAVIFLQFLQRSSQIVRFPH